MRVLVTGASGLLGSHLAAAAKLEGHDVVAHSRATAELSTYGEVAELLDRSDPEAIFHAAARVPVDGTDEPPFAFFEDNARATLNLLHAAAARRVPRFVFSSTMSVYGTPHYLPVDESHPLAPENAYAISKLEGEWYGRLHSQLSGMRVTVLRCSGIYGAGQKRGAIPAFIGRCAGELPITLYARGRQSSDFVWVEDVVQAHLLALRADHLPRFDVFNIGSGIEITIAELASRIRELSDASSELIPSDEASGRDFRFVFDIAKAGKVLGYTPTRQEISLARCIEQWDRGEW